MGTAEADATQEPPPQSHGAGGGGMVPAVTRVPLSRQSWSPCPRGPRSRGTTPSARSSAPGSSGRTESSSDSRREQAEGWDWGEGGPTHGPLTLLSCRFIGSGIRHCFTRNLDPHLPHFFSSYFVLVGTEAAACLFICLTAERFGRRAILLLCTVLTGISSLLLLALTQCKEGRGTLRWAAAPSWGLGVGTGCVWGGSVQDLTPVGVSPPPQTCWTSLS